MIGYTGSLGQLYIQKHPGNRGLRGVWQSSDGQTSLRKPSKLRSCAEIGVWVLEGSLKNTSRQLLLVERDVGVVVGGPEDRQASKWSGIMRDR